MLSDSSCAAALITIVFFLCNFAFYSLVLEVLRLLFNLKLKKNSNLSMVKILSNARV